MIKSINIVRLGNNCRSLMVILAFMLFFFITACGESDTSERKSFDFNLRGTWLSADNSVFAGELFIDFSRITIIGYQENQALVNGVVDEKRPFREFTKQTPLVGYSEDGIFFIQNAGEWYEIPYLFFTENSGRDRFLRFNFGDRMELLRRVPD